MGTSRDERRSELAALTILGNARRCNDESSYAKKWQKETDEVRKIAVDCGLTEALKWGKRCFTFQNKNVAIVIPLKESCAFSFFKGALLEDPKHILERIGDHTQAARWIKFTSVREIALLRSTLTNYISEAIALEESGKKVELKNPSGYRIPEELQSRLDDNAVLRAAFGALSPGRRKSYVSTSQVRRRQKPDPRESRSACL